MTYISLLKYWTIAVVHMRSRLTYRTALIAEIPIIILRVWISSHFYQATYNSSTPDQFAHLSVAAVVWSTMFVQCFNTASSRSAAKQIDKEVKTGTLAYSINRPYSYILYHYAAFLGRTLPALLIDVPVGMLAAWYFVGPISTSWTALMCGLCLMLGGYTLNFLFELSIGLLAFYIEDTSSLIWLYSKAIVFFGGFMIPLELFPPSLKIFAQLLPFGQLYASAAQLIVAWQPATCLRFAVLQLIWLIIAGLLSRHLFNKGIKNVSLQGG
ncbi:hypothetical protein KG892_01670 [Vermiphilus pyriformis]|uniref:ABC transporter permease n=1 Tax=candidate division TM6 bacterium JCVI TM6SC1 TaxID=1306947 RepID=A0A0D2JEZ2_9BACT|nr:hypothetical protein J120_01490 [candidate division TM6 bacterium JCVI TM6SC1]UNE35710.1 MAG: hypothetical protein KG892_01670 [Vermiphilus pyriformis]